MYFQNPFQIAFVGSLSLGDHNFSANFKCPGNCGRGPYSVLSFGTAPFNLSGNDVEGDSKAILNIKFSFNGNRDWVTYSVNVTSGAASVSAVTATEIVAALNANDVFSTHLVARVRAASVEISLKTLSERFNFFVANGQAEEVLKFNKHAGVAELPTFFERHTVENTHAYSDGLGLLIALDPSNAVSAAVINNAVDMNGNNLGFSSASVQEDYELLRGTADAFMFKKQTVDGSDRVTEIIEYAAGSVAGSLARKTVYTYTSSNTNPDEIMQIPHVLVDADLITP